MKAHAFSAGYRAAKKCAGYRAAFVIALALFAIAVPVAAENIDLVVMVDTSQSMFPYFDDLLNSLIHDLLTTRLHRGDTFHLLSFAGTPEVEISLEINSVDAAQRAFGRLLLLHPLGKYTDLVAALQFLWKYARELPETNRKQILLLTDGIHDPPPGSPNRGGEETIARAIRDVAESIRQQGWGVHILKVPAEPAPQDASLKSYLPSFAQELGVPIVPYTSGDREHLTGRTTGFPTLAFPASLGKVGHRFVAPFKVHNYRNEPIIVKLSGIQSEGTELLDKQVSLVVPAGGAAILEAVIRLPLSFPHGERSLGIRLLFEDDTRISPTTGTLSFTYTGKGGIPVPRLTLLYVLYIVLGLAVVFLLVQLFLFMRKKLREVSIAGHARTNAQPAASAVAPRVSSKTPPSRAHGRALIPLLSAPGSASPVAAAQSPLPASVSARKRVRPTVTSVRRALPKPQAHPSSLPPMIEMRVGLQNPHVGFRNVHRIPSGTSRSVGGGLSTYLVFLVPVPSRIGEIRNAEGRYIFSPLRADFFPGLAGPVQDCLGKEIAFVGARGKRMTLHFRQWISPLEEINRIMRSVSRDR